MELLDLVAIGTIADMVSLTDENRILVQYGLECWDILSAIGLQEMLDMAGIASNRSNRRNGWFPDCSSFKCFGALG